MSYTCPMESFQFLNPSEIKDKCEEIKEILQTNINDLKTTDEGLQKFVRNDQIESNSINELKLHINSYSSIISGIVTCFEYEISELSKLSSSVGKEKLEGTVINPKANDYYKKMVEAQEQVDYWCSKAKNWNPFFGVCPYYSLIEFYELKVVYNEAKFKKWDGKANNYVKIENETKDIFKNYDEIRLATRTALYSIEQEWKNGKITYNALAEWRTNLSEVSAKLIEDVQKEFYKIKNGKKEFDWDAIDEYLQKPASEVSEIEAIAMAKIISEMSTNDLQKLMNHASYESENSSWLSRSYETSQSLGIALDYYTVIAEMECEMTIFNSDMQSKLDTAAEATIKNDLTKAVMLNLLYDRMTSVSAGSRHIIDIKENIDRNGFVSYECSDTPNDPTDALDLLNSGSNYQSTYSLGEALYNTTNARTFNVNPWVDSSALDFKGDELAKKVMKKYHTDASGFAIEQAAGIAGDMAIGKLAEYVPGVDKVYTIEKLAVDAAKAYAQNVDLNSAADIIDMINILNSMQMGCMVSLGDGIFANEVIFSEAKYDPVKLEIDVQLYNEYLKSLGKTPDCSAQKLIESISEGGDITIAKEYQEWYAGTSGNNGEHQIDAYWEAVNRGYAIYMNNNPNCNINSINELSAEQVRKIHDMYENNDYSGSL